MGRNLRGMGSRPRDTIGVDAAGTGHRSLVDRPPRFRAGGRRPDRDRNMDGHFHAHFRIRGRLYYRAHVRQLAAKRRPLSRRGCLGRQLAGFRLVDHYRHGHHVGRRLFRLRRHTTEFRTRCYDSRVGSRFATERRQFLSLHGRFASSGGIDSCSDRKKRSSSPARFGRMRSASQSRRRADSRRNRRQTRPFKNCSKSSWYWIGTQPSMS